MAKVDVEPSPPSCSQTQQGWPTIKELCDIMEEESLDYIASIGGPDGVAGLIRRLGSDGEKGLCAEDYEARRRWFGGNFFAEKKLAPYWKLVWDALHDHTMILLLVMATISLIAEMAWGEHPETGWIESVAIYVSVIIIVNVGAGTDYTKERMFQQLTHQLDESNKKFVIRGGEQVEVVDRDIVVGDLLSFNAHNAASLPADGILVDGVNVKCDESALTGEPEPIPKSADVPCMLSGTNVTSGSGKMLVVAVGAYSVSGKIKSKVYGEAGDDDDESPLFTKLDILALRIGKGGAFVSLLCFLAMCIIGLGVNGDDPKKIIKFIITAITIMAVAVPEGLPLAVTLSLAFSSQQMYKDQNLVKQLESCETMGSATTICTDKTGTLTANRMTVRGAYIGTELFPNEEKPIGSRVMDSGKLGKTLIDLLGNMLCICTMDESNFVVSKKDNTTLEFKGNPTECSMLVMAKDMGYNYQEIRQNTRGRSDKTKADGHVLMFTSARKMMSWILPRDNGGYRVLAKGASEIVLGRVKTAVDNNGNPRKWGVNEDAQVKNDVIGVFAGDAMRTIAFAYRDFESAPPGGWEALHAEETNADGTPAFIAETELTLFAIIGIEDPLREEVKPAITQCYTAGIDVRMVTGDNLETAIAIATRAGILRPCDFAPDIGVDKLVLRHDRAMEGKTFRKRVHNGFDKETGEPLFDQEAFDKIWPYLRVLARSSPEDKHTLANGLNQSLLFQNEAFCKKIYEDEGITIFPDRQVIAMTGDGTNDAPALKRADVGFAMGIAGTQIAKDAADIILLDDNFASIVTAAKWGRNVYDSIQKFLQFQLTVNIAAIVCAVVGAFYCQESPIAAVQMLWVNLIMDSLASLALATEPPTERLLQRAPVNRSTSIITEQMWYNMLGHACYQIIVVMFILFSADKMPNKDGGTGMEPGWTFDGEPNEHYTIIFTAFVLMQLFNEINCRKLEGEFFVFSGLFKNPYFVSIWITTMVLQIIMTQFGGHAIKCVGGGLNMVQFLICLGIGLGEFLWQFVINFVNRATRERPGKKASGVSGMTRFSSSLTGGDGRTKLPPNSTRKSSVKVDNEVVARVSVRRASQR